MISLLDLVYPSPCLVCGQWPERGEKSLCMSCLSQIPHNRPPFCPTCGKPYVGIEAAPRCGACEGKDLPFERLWFAAPYEGILREALHKLKYERKKPVAIPLSHLLISFAKEYLPGFSFDWILPVPLSSNREWERGFNQSELFATSLSKALAIPLSVRNLIRLRDTRPQVDLPKAKRFENIRGAFTVKHPSPYVGKSLLLIDDVVTTGATLSECARALREAGVKSVSALTLASGSSP